MLKPMKHLFGKSLIISGKYKKFETPIVLEKIEKILQFLFVRFNLFALSFIILVCTKKAYQHKYDILLKNYIVKEIKVIYAHIIGFLLIRMCTIKSFIGMCQTPYGMLKSFVMSIQLLHKI